MARFLQIILTGLMMIVTLQPVSSICEEFNTCITKFGYNMGTESDSQSPDYIFDFICQHQDMLPTCFNMLTGCKDYTTIKTYLPSENRLEAELNLLCNHKGEVKKAVKCVTDATQSLTGSEQQTSKTCEQNMQTTDQCKLLQQAMKCSPQTKTVVSCMRDVVNLMNKNGLSVPCADVFRSTSSGNAVGVSAMIISICLLITTLSIFP